MMALVFFFFNFFLSGGGMMINLKGWNFEDDS